MLSVRVSMFFCIAMFSVRLFGFVVWLLGPLFGRWGQRCYRFDLIMVRFRLSWLSIRLVRRCSDNDLVGWRPSESWLSSS